MPSTKWTEEEAARALRRWNEGASAATIAYEMRGCLSRNIVIGRLSRMKGEKRRRDQGPARFRPPPRRGPKPGHGTDGGLAVQVIRGIQRKPDRPPVSPEDASRAFGTPCALLDLTAASCRWPIGNGPYLFCNAVALDTYCPHHHALAYTVGRERQRVAA